MLAALTFLVGVAYLPGVMSAAAVGRWTVAACGVALLLWTIRIKPGPGHWWGLAFLGWCAASMLWTASMEDTAGSLLQLAVLAGAFCIGAETRDIRPCLIAVGCAALVSALFVVTQAGGVHPVYAAPAGTWPGLFLNRDTGAEFAAAALVAMIGLRRWELVPGAAVAALLPGSRGAVLALVAAAACWAWTQYPRERGRVLTVAIGAVAVLAGAQLMDGSRLASLLERVAIWQVTALNLSPIGWGLGTYASLLPAFEYAHNEPLHFVFELGGGAVLLACLLAQSLREPEPCARAVLVAILAAALVGFPLHAPATAFLAAVLAGHLCGVRDRRLAAERDRRTASPECLGDAGALGIGAPSAADIRRKHLPA